MFRTGLNRRLIALVAAYALALQALLVGAVALSPATAAAVVICRGASIGGTQRDLPAAPHHDVGCALCTLACAGSAALPANVPTVAPIAGPGTALRQPHHGGSLARAIVRAGSARGPPA
jgi:DUF2946 family protein